MPRHDALEQAILADPEALEPRMIYADWLESQGVAIGEWAALQRAIEAAPHDLALRMAALRYLQGHTRDLLGDGAELLDGMYLGWRGGFLDEIRLHGTEHMAREGNAGDRFGRLLRHPIARFVRTIALGSVEDTNYDGMLDVLVDHAPPTLRSLVMFDAWDPSSPQPPIDVSPESIADVLVAFPRLRRLGLSRVSLDSFPYQDLPAALEELVIWGPAGDIDLGRARLPKLAELALIDPMRDGPAAPQLGSLPALRTLRVIGTDVELRELLVACRSVLPPLEVLDVSHGDVEGARDLLARYTARIIAVHPARARGYAAHICYGDAPVGESWLLDRLATGGRDSLAVTPHAGVGLHNAAYHFANQHRHDIALAAATTAMTLPDAFIVREGWGSVAHSLFCLDRPLEAELAAREGLLRFPRAAMFTAGVIEALRVQARTTAAVALVPDALHSLTAKTRAEEATDCMLQIVLALDANGELERAIATAVRKQRVAPWDADLTGAVAWAHLGLGQVEAARALAPADVSESPQIALALAAIAVHDGDLDAGLAHLHDAQRRRFRPWAPLLDDKRFARLRDNPQFVAMF